jgi:hypothetical protein
VARASQLLDLTRPVAVSLIAILNAITDADDPHAIVATLMDAVPSGSFLTLTHLASDLLDPEAQDGLADVNGQMMRKQVTSRDREQVARFFEGMDLLEPGLVRVEEWRPRPGERGTGRSKLGVRSRANAEALQPQSHLMATAAAYVALTTTFGTSGSRFTFIGIFGCDRLRFNPLREVRRSARAVRPGVTQGRRSRR